MSDAPINVGGNLAHLDTLLRAMQALCERLADAAACQDGGYETLTALEACIECARHTLDLPTEGFEAVETSNV